MTDDAVARQTAAEMAHWLLAAQGLADLDDAAAPEAWAGLESYLSRGLRDRLAGMVAALVQEARGLQRLAVSGADPAATRAGVLRLRQRYLQAETVLDFYGDAINSRTNPALRGLLRGLDTLAGDSMAATLAARHRVPAGPGVRRQGPGRVDPAGRGPAVGPRPPLARGRDQADPAQPVPPDRDPARDRPPGGPPDRLDRRAGRRAARRARSRSADVAQLWRSWAGEVAADVHAFAQAGWAPVFALANVVDGTTAEVFRIRYGDPHPFGWIRVLFNVALCRSWFGPGPWDDVAQAWGQRHPAARADPEARLVARVSVDALADLVDVCTRRPMRAFRGAPLAAVIDPQAVAPDRLQDLERQAGPPCSPRRTCAAGIPCRSSPC